MQTVAVPDRHLLVWRDPPVWPFMWRGLLPLLALALVALYALGPFARTGIEASVQRETRGQLDAAGFRWVGLGVSGQNVTLSGEQPVPGAGERAVALARSVTCPTWSGRRLCAVSVRGEFAPPPPFSATAPAPAGSVAQACDRSFASVLGAEQIEFASASAAIEARSGPLLDRLAHQVRACPGAIRIEGHTDSVGRGEFNRALSEARAAAVRDALVARGIPAAQLQAEGFGARRPIGDNRTEEGRTHNRRIELHAITAD